MTPPNILIYLLRRDLRLEDNPIFHAAATDAAKTYTHLLPVYAFPAQQIEVSGFIPEDSEEKSPYPEARSSIGKFWRCGPHRAKFIAESVWELKETLGNVGSGLEVRVGMLSDVLKDLLAGFKFNGKGVNIAAVWMTAEEGVEEKLDEKDCKTICDAAGVDFKLWKDEKYFVDDDDVPLKDISELPDVFTTYRKLVEPLLNAPRALLPTPAKGTLPPLPPMSIIPPQSPPFVIPNSYEDLESSLLSPVSQSPLPTFPLRPSSMPPSPTLHGGSQAAQSRLLHLLESGAITTYKDTRNDLMGADYSVRLSSYLSQGCITARQIHNSLVSFESGDSNLPSCASTPGFGKGETDGTSAVRYELLWRDYMRLCTRKYDALLFSIGGFRRDFSQPWTTPSTDPASSAALARFLNGTTGTGLIDASQRELAHTGYTSSRARQNVANFLAKHLELDWRLGAEWYEYALEDYDVSSCWGNWQYVAGVGNDPRGDGRSFNPIKQSWDYDPKGEYCRAWIVELGGVGEDNGGLELSPGECFQAWTMAKERQVCLGIQGLEWVRTPLKPIEFTVERKQKGARRADAVDGQGYRGGRGAGRGAPMAQHRGRGGGYPGGGAYSAGGAPYGGGGPYGGGPVYGGGGGYGGGGPYGGGYITYNTRGDWNPRGNEPPRGPSLRGRGGNGGRWGRGGYGPRIRGPAEGHPNGAVADAGVDGQSTTA
ncbi:hypothetical protein V499_09618 [Pseudogymnoascus sp. VKM F-103]|uniref:Cryptochrome DASH n=1 Tax=Pseudogymnoascus verrucosus TaxID=342668 RepID=A0A1B8GP60_9PEZI|nr:uncharacterized protein VE01_04549 [Pseudogymnoascus verrucosus]KFY69919.1 hypothetical protein V499_09618 [Pseudogymnoascus sp. VKM F-103]OBT97617.1 hypothetical protein VE01_04549 [Pseudogymnoascus verrucosus]